MRALLGAALGLGLVSGFAADAPVAGPSPELRDFLPRIARDPRQQAEAFRQVEARWDTAFVAPLIEIASLSFDERIFPLLRRRTGEKSRDEFHAWFVYVWTREPRVPAFYAEFKAQLYGRIDPRFREYFAADRPATIRLDEIRWGGVKRDGIPPLKNPAMIPV